MNDTERMELDWDYMQDLLQDAPDSKEGFTVDTDRKAEWAASTVKHEMEEAQRLVKLADDEINALKARQQEITERAERRTAFLREQLRGYLAAVKPSRTTKTKTVYELLNAQLVLKKQAPEYVRDDEALIAWAEANAPAYVTSIPKLSWGELKKETELNGDQVVYRETGEVIPGLKAVARADVFEVV